MCTTEKEYLEKLRTHAAKARTFLSNKMKPERERAVCRAFLRTLGVSFKDHELIARTVDQIDVDVEFREARFQVMDVPDPDHRRGDYWKQKQTKYDKATSTDETTGPFPTPVPVNLDTLIPDVIAKLSGKAAKYGKGCKDLDALAYVDLKGKFLAPDSQVRNIEPLRSQGWRSVSLLFPWYGVVLFANEHAPYFLRQAEGQLRMEWADIHTLFDEHLS